MPRSRRRGDLATLVRLVDRGALHPEIGLLADWSQTATALSDLRATRLRGNAVFTIERSPSDDRSRSTDRHRAATSPPCEAGDLSTVRDSFAETPPGARRRLPISGHWRGRDVIVDEFLGGARSFFEPGSVRSRSRSLFAEGDKVSLEWTSRARTAAGEPYENHCAGVFTVRDGRSRPCASTWTRTTRGRPWRYGVKATRRRGRRVPGGLDVAERHGGGVDARAARVDLGGQGGRARRRSRAC